MKLDPCQWQFCFPDIAFVQFSSKADVKEATSTKYDKKQINGQKVTISKCQESPENDDNDAASEEAAVTVESLATDSSLQPEPLADSGRLFIRNLPFMCTKEDLTALFEEFGEDFKAKADGFSLFVGGVYRDMLQVRLLKPFCRLIGKPIGIRASELSPL